MSNDLAVLEAEAEPLGGRPSQYEPSFCGIVRNLAKLGLPLTTKQLATVFGVCERTITYWKAQNPEFLRSVEGSALEFDIEVASKLHELTQGCEWVEEQAFKCRKVTYADNGKKLLEEEDVKVVEVTKRTPPNQKSIEFWLMNRRPQHWSRKIELNGVMRTPEQEAERQAAMSADIRKLLPKMAVIDLEAEDE